jgi:L-2-hydroxyglutarate oxidase LhgO
METYDVCIVGAGVIGCAIARELGHKFPRRLRVVVFEQGKKPAAGTVEYSIAASTNIPTP